MKANKLDQKSPGATTLININQYNTDKQNLEEEIGELIKKLLDVSGLVTTTNLKQKSKTLIPELSG